MQHDRRGMLSGQARSGRRNRWNPGVLRFARTTPAIAALIGAVALSPTAFAAITPSGGSASSAPSHLAPYQSAAHDGLTGHYIVAYRHQVSTSVISKAALLGRFAARALAPSHATARFYTAQLSSAQ